jgi:hypothetical protein
MHTGVLEQDCSQRFILQFAQMSEFSLQTGNREYTAGENHRFIQHQ